MSTYLHDLQTNATAGVSLAPAVRTTSANGTGVDLIQADSLCTVVVLAGTITDGTSTIAVEESTNDSAYTSVTLLESLTALTATTTPQIQFASFQRTKRYCRAVVTCSTITSGGVFGVAILEQTKFIGSSV